MATDVKTGIGRFVWHGCMTTDVASAKAFYTQLLGWETEIFKPGEMDYEMISVGGATHGGFGTVQGGAPPHWLGHVQVEDCDAACARAIASGGSRLGEPMDVPEVGRMCVIADPQGAVFSIYQPATTGPGAEGCFVWDELMTSDVEAAKTFYGSVFGWTSGEMDMGENGTYTMFRREGGVDTAGCMEKPSEMPVPAAWVTYAMCPDVDATVARVPGLGGTVVVPAFDVPGIGRISIIADPTGAVLGLFQPAAA